MKNDDVELIQRVLAGDESAFTELLKKYQKPVHALAWRKVGDFHIAEEITQDAFLKVYQRLDTLKDPNQFSGWLYVIATRRCYAWLRKKRIRTQPLKDAETTMILRDAYSRHVAEERAKTAVEAQREVVKRLLLKLKESERTVMTLHYFGEMTCEEISKFLGVSAGTIKSRLQRARNRLQKEETMIREALDHFQISPNLTDNILREVARLKPGLPTGSKPLVPWAVAASSALLIMLMLSIGSQYLARFQKPYSLDAQTEMTVELIDAPIVLNLEVKPDIQNQLGNSKALGKSDNRGEKPDAVLLAALQDEGEDVSVPKQKWIQGNVPGGASSVITLFPTPDREIYIVDGGGTIYKLPTDGTEWQYVSDISSLPIKSWDGAAPMAKWNNTLYIVVSNELFASTDGGETWLSVGKCPEGDVIGLVIMNEMFYLGLTNQFSRSADAGKNQVFRSVDAGKTWTAVGDGLTGRVDTLYTIQNTLFATTDIGLYRFDVGSWVRLQFPVPEAGGIRSFAGTEKNLYVMVLLDENKVNDDDAEQTWWIFRSTDKGDSWTDITPTITWSITGHKPWVTLTAVKNTLLVVGWNGAAVARSIDNGDTWTLEETASISAMFASVSEAVALNKQDLRSFEDY